MFKVQHIGIPVVNLESTIQKYYEWGFSTIFKTVLNDGTNVAFIDVSGVILEFYTDNVHCTSNPVIQSLTINCLGPDRELLGPSGEHLILKSAEEIGLKYIDIRTTSIKKTGDDLKMHGFYSKGDYFIQDEVCLRLNYVVDEPENGSINHIAFDHKHILKHSVDLVEKGLTIVEGINFLPFFNNGVIYFVTENHNGLRLEYNQLI